MTCIHDAAAFNSSVDGNPGIASELADLLKDAHAALSAAKLEDDYRREALDTLANLANQLAQPHPDTKLVTDCLSGLRAIAGDLAPVTELSAAIAMIYSVTQ